MFCGQCGKRVHDTMLFCPFCGSPIVIPDQDAEEAGHAMPVEPAEQQPEEAAQEFFEVEEESEIPEEPVLEEIPQPEPEAEFEPLRFDEPYEDEEMDLDPEDPPVSEEPEQVPVRPLSLFDDFPEEEEEVFDLPQSDVQEPDIPDPFQPLDWPEEPDASDAIIPPENPPKPSPPVRQRSEGAVRRSNQTFIPVKDVDLNDMFMDSSHPEPEDAYDPYDDDGGDSVRPSFDFEEPEHGGFLQRHIRGVVGLALLVLLLIIFLFWAIMPKGQQVLAAANLAWRAEPYGELGYTAFNAGQFHQAAVYFERALARKEDDYEYAHSAMVAYYEAEEIDSALAMLKRCIEMNPDSTEPYYELLLIYPNADTRPWEVQELLRLGYERTGDESLNTGTSGE